MSHAPPKPTSGWLNVNETAQALGLHNNTVKRIPPSELPYMRATSRGDRRYWREDVARYINRRMVTGGRRIMSDNKEVDRDGD
jgi:hypothetical protein